MWVPGGKACHAEEAASAKVLRWEHGGASAGMEGGRGEWEKTRSYNRRVG